MRILIIEDEQRVARFLKKGLQQESYSVDIAADGAEGARLALMGEYDVVILDLMLPRKNGLEVLRELRAAHLQTPVLILSAKSEVNDRVEGLELGADDYLPKPFSFSELLARVRSLMRRHASGEEVSSLLTVADLKMDLLTRKVSRGEREVTLTNKEFQLLQYLMRNKGRVLSRVILTEHVWDMDFDSGTNIVDVLINRLRRKIDDGFPVPLIHTVRGVGYVVKEG